MMRHRSAEGDARGEHKKIFMLCNVCLAHPTCSAGACRMTGARGQSTISYSFCTQSTNRCNCTLKGMLSFRLLLKRSSD